MASFTSNLWVIGPRHRANMLTTCCSTTSFTVLITWMPSWMVHQGRQSAEQDECDIPSQCNGACR